MPILRWINRHPVLSIVLMAPLLYSAVILAYGEPLLWTFLDPFVFLPLLFYAGLCFFLRSLSLRWGTLTILRFRNNCDPEPLLRAAREIRARHNLRRRLERLTWFGWGLNEMAALCDLGRWDAAEAVLQELVPWQSKMQAMYQANYLLNRREEAMPYLRFVAQNGGKLWYRQWAVEQLSAGIPSCDTPV